jgi:hypothetical protein
LRCSCDRKGKQKAEHIFLLMGRNDGRGDPWLVRLWMYLAILQG